MILSNFSRQDPNRGLVRARLLEMGIGPTIVCLCMPAAVIAGPLDMAPTPLVTQQNAVSPYGGPLVMSPFHYVPVPNATTNQGSESSTPKRSPEQQRIVDLSADGNYQAAGTAGLALMEKEKPDAELQLIFANSLAWSGRLTAAIKTYQGITEAKYVNEAGVGMANAQRWLGRDDQALPVYQAVLDRDPGNADAQEGLELASRELSPRTTLSVGDSRDSFDMHRKSAFVNHRWRNSDGSAIMEVETSAVQDTILTNQANQQEVTLRYQDLSLMLKPSIELSLPSPNANTLYGSAQIRFDDDQDSISVGRVNWGRIALNPNALVAQLSASHFGLTAKRNFLLGNVVGHIDYYDISDGNSIVTTGLHLASNWRPIGNNIKPFIGMETRQAKFKAENYWSPDNGAGTYYAGVLGEWGLAEWNFYASAQYGVRMYGDAGNGWSASAGGKRWLSRDLAISMSMWSMSSWRDNTEYRAQSANLNLEKLWR